MPQDASRSTPARPTATTRRTRDNPSPPRSHAISWSSQRNVCLGRKLREWRNWLANEGPILTRLDVDDTWRGAKATKGVLEEYHPTTDAGHAVALVGYDDDHFIVRNSWGRNWGDQGFEDNRSRSLPPGRPPDVHPPVQMLTMQARYEAAM